MAHKHWASQTDGKQGEKRQGKQRDKEGKWSNQQRQREGRDQKRTWAGIRKGQVGKEPMTPRISEWKNGAGDKQLQLLVLQEHVWDPDRNF